MRTKIAVTLSLLVASAASGQTASRQAVREHEAQLRTALEAQHRAAKLEARHGLGSLQARQEALAHASALLHEQMTAQHEAQARLAEEAVHAEAAHVLLGSEGPPEGWAPQDPADSLWRRARERLNAGDPQAAARLFHQIRTDSRHARSAYRPDAFYWEAFSLVRVGGEDSLREARAVLEALEQAYPPERRSPDAATLAARIEAELAGRGSVEAARELYAKLAAPSRTPVKPAEAAALAKVMQEEKLQALTETRRASEGATRNAAEALLRAEETKTADLLRPKTRNDALLQTEQVRAATELLRARELETTLNKQAPLLALRMSAQCRNDEEEIRLIALNALVEMEDSAALPALREVLARRDECAPQLRRHALMILARRSSPGTEALALEAARTDPDPEVRQMALTWLIEKDNSAALDIAQSLLGGDTDRQTRQAAIIALARSRNERARQILRDFVRSNAPTELRGEALMALPPTRDKADVQFLRQLYGETQDRQLKEYALMALGRRALEGESDWLLGIAQDENEDAELRAQALYMLRSDPSVSTSAIAGLFDRAGERRLREAALMILAERSASDAVALDKLIAIARTEKELDLRRQAVATLARSQDPRAHAVLLEIVRNR
jgi:HEAT repeat protein